MHRNDIWQHTAGAYSGPPMPGVKVHANSYVYHASHASILGETVEAPIWPPCIGKLPYLYTYQEEGLRWSRDKCGYMYVYDMRMGKTVLALAGISTLSLPSIIIAPLNTRDVWRNWVNRIFGEGVFETDTASLEAGKIYFAHYQVAHKITAGRDPHPRIHCLILDEAHRLGNGRLGRGAKHCAYLTVNSDRRIALTGTPMWNRVRSLWNILSVINPGAWGTFHDFGCRYAGGMRAIHGWEYPGISHEAELRHRLRSVQLVKTWRDYGGLPVNRTVVPVCPDLPLRSVRDMDVAALSRHMQEIGVAKARKALSKIKVLVEHEKSVVWVYHKEVGEMLKKELKCPLIHGSVSAKKRLQIVTDWKVQSRQPLIATILSMQEGVDLQPAKQNIFLEYCYVPAVMDQAEMRTYSRESPCYSLFFVSEHDHRVRDLLAEKRDMQSRLLAAPSGTESAANYLASLRDRFSI